MGVADELTKLAALRDGGAITQEEFDRQRAILLPPAVPTTKPPNRKGVVAVVLLALVGLFVYGSLTGTGGVAVRTGPPVAEGWSVPAGFTRVPDEDAIVFRWLDDSEFSCDIGDQCWGMEVIARDGCASSLYVELNIEDASGTAVGYTNDTVGSLKPDQKARLVFDNLEATGRKASIGDVSCY